MHTLPTEFSQAIYIQPHSHTTCTCSHGAYGNMHARFQVHAVVCSCCVVVINFLDFITVVVVVVVIAFAVVVIV